jgi:hypothetical protein
MRLNTASWCVCVVLVTAEVEPAEPLLYGTLQAYGLQWAWDKKFCEFFGIPKPLSSLQQIFPVCLSADHTRVPVPQSLQYALTFSWTTYHRDSERRKCLLWLVKFKVDYNFMHFRCKLILQPWIQDWPSCSTAHTRVTMLSFVTKKTTATFNFGSLSLQGGIDLEHIQ